MFSQYGQEGEPIHPSTTRVFVGLAEGGAATLQGEVVRREVGVREWVGEALLEVVTRDETVEAEDGTDIQNEPRAAPAIPELRVKSVTLLS